jgi:hypothetical protein
MATFKPQNYECELNFDDKFTFKLPLHEETASKIAAIGQAQKEKMQALRQNDATEIDSVYNSLLDAIDDILGEGAADKIVTLFAHPGLMEIASVILYISTEYKEQYNKAINSYKTEGNVPPVTVKRGRR